MKNSKGLNLKNKIFTDFAVFFFKNIHFLVREQTLSYSLFYQSAFGESFYGEKD